MRAGTCGASRLVIKKARSNGGPTCDTVPVATLVRVVGIDPFPGPPERLKRDAMALPPPEDSPYAHAGRERHRRRREGPGFLEWLLGEQEMAMTKLPPFADDAASMSIGKLTVGTASTGPRSTAAST